MHFVFYIQNCTVAGRISGCHALASAFAEWVPNKDALILDCGAGTGFAAKEVSTKDFTEVLRHGRDFYTGVKNLRVPFLSVPLSH